MKKWLLLSLLAATACGGAQNTDVRTINHSEVNVDGAHRLARNVVPKRYALDLTVDPSKDVF
ncbi:MAG: hypothetical protein R3E66_01235, partial [bacterium]